MQLSYVRDFLSITSFKPVELATFTVITGVNGAGKSHLLRGIADGSVSVGDIQKDEIVLFTNENFRLENQGELTTENAVQERFGAWDMFQQATNYNLVGNLSSLRVNMLQSIEEQILAAAARSQKPIWKLGEGDGLTAEELERLRNYRRAVETFVVNHNQLRGNHQALSILTLAKKIDFFIDQISKEQFYELYEPRHFKENFLPSQLTLAFADYYSKLDDNDYRKFRNSTKGESNPVLSDDDFVKRHGPRPWDVINQVLTQIGTVPYRINSPEGISRHDRFQAKLVHQSDPRISPHFEDLSSGEKVLIALVVSVYKATSDRNFPKLLLLDEIDASLHPSMMQGMLNIIEDVFVASGVATILVTHSPTTIAMAPDESIYVMRQSGEDRLDRRTRADALEILTEGFVTLDQGMRLLDAAARTKVSVITEGKNTEFLRRAFTIYGVTGVEVISGVEDVSGSTQLRTLYDFFVRLPHRNIVVFAWDCDADKFRSLASRNNTFPYVFAKNPDNSVARRGVENLFDVSLMEGFKKEIHFSTGEVKIEFDESQKKRFADHVLSRNADNDFLLFQDFTEFVRRLADGASA